MTTDCAVNGCERPFALGSDFLVCATHDRYMRNGFLLSDLRPLRSYLPRRGRCETTAPDGGLCNEPVHAGAECRYHYDRFNRGLDPWPKCRRCKNDRRPTKKGAPMLCVGCLEGDQL